MDMPSKRHPKGTAEGGRYAPGERSKDVTPGKILALGNHPASDSDDYGLNLLEMCCDMVENGQETRETALAFLLDHYESSEAESDTANSKRLTQVMQRARQIFGYQLDQILTDTT